VSAPATTIFTTMTALAEETGAINLGQGFPDEDGPAEVVDAAVAALRSGTQNQYAPLAGVPPLIDAIRAHQRRRYGLDVEDVQVTFGATEALSCAILGLLSPGDELVALEPVYDSYEAISRLAGATLRRVGLHPPAWRLDVDELRAAITPRTRLLLLNTPHNPTGRVLDRAELEGIAALCVEHDLIAVTDEVYEHLVLAGEHIPLATLPGMAQRTLTISSVGKTYSFTGWKIGWASGPAELVRAVRGVKQFLSFAGGTPLQHATAAALDAGDLLPDSLAATLRAKRDRLVGGLAAAGFGVLPSQGTYFVCADVAALGHADAQELALRLPHEAGVVAIPVGASSPTPTARPAPCCASPSASATPSSTRRSSASPGGRRADLRAEDRVGAVVVELVHLDGPGRGRVEAQAAEHALVDVALHDLHVAVAGRVDVDGADLLELGGDRRVARDLVGDLDADEDGVGSHAATPSFCFMMSGICEISSATVMPASASRAIFSPAVSSLPSTIVPAWPKLMPGISSMNRPAMKATIGRRESFAVTHSASWASMRPPGSV
jgi:N-succinyldiaminopimelate aminotransferase